MPKRKPQRNTWYSKYVYAMYDEYSTYSCINSNGSANLRPLSPGKWSVEVNVALPNARCGDDFETRHTNVTGTLNSAKRAALRFLAKTAKAIL